MQQQHVAHLQPKVAQASPVGFALAREADGHQVVAAGQPQFSESATEERGVRRYGGLQHFTLAGAQQLGRLATVLGEREAGEFDEALNLFRRALDKQMIAGLQGFVGGKARQAAAIAQYGHHFHRHILRHLLQFPAALTSALGFLADRQFA